MLAAAFGLSGCDLFSSGDPAERQASQWQTEPSTVSAEALRAAVKDADVRRFYEARNWAAAWDANRIAGLTAALAQAKRHALDHVPFLPASVPDDPAAREAALTKAARAAGIAVA